MVEDYLRRSRRVGRQSGLQYRSERGIACQRMSPDGLLVHAFAVIVRSGIVLFALCALVSALFVLRPSSAIADDSDSEATPAEDVDGYQGEPQVVTLQPSNDPNMPVVRLTSDGPYVPWDAMKLVDFTLTDQTGSTVTLGDLKGRPWVASFIFTHCAMACPKMMGHLAELRQRLREVDVMFVTITVDPERDTVERLAQYGEVYGVDPENWLLLTGPEQEIYRLIRQGFKVSAWEDTRNDRMAGFEFAHSMKLIHVDANGQIVGQYDSTAEQERRSLQRVLLGHIETPDENRPIPPNAIPDSAPGPTGDEPSDATSPERADLEIPGWVTRLPTTNAMLNGLATVLLIFGFRGNQVRQRLVAQKIDAIRVCGVLALSGLVPGLPFWAQVLHGRVVEEVSRDRYDSHNLFRDSDYACGSGGGGSDPGGGYHLPWAPRAMGAASPLGENHVSNLALCVYHRGHNLLYAVQAGLIVARFPANGERYLFGCSKPAILGVRPIRLHCRGRAIEPLLTLQCADTSSMNNVEEVMGRQLIVWMLVAMVASFALPGDAVACPQCKLANDADDARPAAYQYSIMFMLGMPITLLAGYGFLFWRLSRKQTTMAETVTMTAEQTGTRTTTEPPRPSLGRNGPQLGIEETA